MIGLPQPKGSTKSFGYVVKNRSTGQPIVKGNGQPLIGTVTTSDNPRLKDWQQMIAGAAQRAMEAQTSPALFVDAVSLAVLFELPRPASLPKRVTAHVKKPDLDKLARAVKDALKNIIWRDDSQVVEIFARKRYAEPSAPARALIAVEG